MSRTAIVGIVIACLLGAACEKSKGAPAGEQSAPADNGPSAAVPNGTGAGPLDNTTAKEIFGSRCAACHGPTGHGDGPGAAALNPKPRNYHDKDWQAKVTDDEITKAITYGGAAIGKSPMMPANPDLDSKPEVVAALVHIVRDFGK
jgi:mono/diheme cytochrome c family protein